MLVQDEYSAYLNLDAFFLSIVIFVCIILSIAICILTWLKDRDYKYAFTYLIFILLVYQVSSLLAFYAPPQHFESLIVVKMIFAVLLKSAVLIWLAAYTRKDWMAYVFIALHLFTIAFVGPIFFSPLRDAVVSFSPPNVATYEVGSRIYTVISSIVYIAAGILFYATSSHFRRKRRYLVFLLAFISFNIGLLVLGSFFSQDVLYEKMHIAVLLTLLAFFCRMTPFFDKTDWILTSANMMQGVGETAVILDAWGKAIYSHSGIENFDVAVHLDALAAEIERQKEVRLAPGPGHALLRPEPLQERGEPHLTGALRFSQIPDGPIDLQYKLTPLFYRGARRGTIMVLRDITAYTRAVQKLQEKNLLLEDALTKKKAYLHQTRRIKGEEERGRILGQVNQVTREYLDSLRRWVSRFNGAAPGAEESFTGLVKKQNEEMLALTRKTIVETRQAVRRLNQPGGEQEVSS